MGRRFFKTYATQKVPKKRYLQWFKPIFEQIVSILSLSIYRIYDLWVLSIRYSIINTHCAHVQYIMNVLKMICSARVVYTCIQTSLSLSLYIYIYMCVRLEMSQKRKNILKRRNLLRLSHTSSSVLFTSSILLFWLWLLLLL